MKNCRGQVGERGQVCTVFVGDMMMKTRDLIAKRERREKARARREKYDEQHNTADNIQEERQDEYVLREGFPDEVADEVRQIPANPVTSEEILRRRDMREALTFTIDPDDAKDFDDALSFEELEDGHYRVGVHIADVTHYVKEGTATWWGK